MAEIGLLSRARALIALLGLPKEADVIVFPILLTAAVFTATQHIGTTAPESFRANAQVKGTDGAGAATLVIAVDRYNTEKDRAALQQALKTGNDAFLAALRKMPAVGSIEAGGQKFPVHYAFQQTDPKGRSIVVVTGSPVFFVGGGAADAKPRRGIRRRGGAVPGRQRRSRQRLDGRRRESEGGRSGRRRDRGLRNRGHQAGHRDTESEVARVCWNVR